MTRPCGTIAVSTGVCSLLKPFACDMVETMAGVSSCSFVISIVSFWPGCVSPRILFPVSRHSLWVKLTILQIFRGGAVMKDRPTYHGYRSKYCHAASVARVRQRELVWQRQISASFSCHRTATLKQSGCRTFGCCERLIWSKKEQRVTNKNVPFWLWSLKSTDFVTQHAPEIVVGTRICKTRFRQCQHHEGRDQQRCEDGNRDPPDRMWKDVINLIIARHDRV